MYSLIELCHILYGCRVVREVIAWPLLCAQHCELIFFADCQAGLSSRQNYRGYLVWCCALCRLWSKTRWYDYCGLTEMDTDCSVSLPLTHPKATDSSDRLEAIEICSEMNSWTEERKKASLGFGCSSRKR